MLSYSEGNGKNNVVFTMVAYGRHIPIYTQTAGYIATFYKRYMWEDSNTIFFILQILLLYTNYKVTVNIQILGITVTVTTLTKLHYLKWLGNGIKQIK